MITDIVGPNFKLGDFVIGTSNEVLKIDSIGKSNKVTCIDMDGTIVVCNEQDLRFATQEDINTCFSFGDWKHKNWASKAQNWLTSHGKHYYIEDLSGIDK